MSRPRQHPSDPRAPAPLRRGLVDDLERRGAIRTSAVRDAFLAVPREAFLAEFAAREGLAAVYRDEVVVTRLDAQGVPISSSSQPAIMAEMLEQLALEPGMRVLEVGAGTGYNAALLARIVGATGTVTTVDLDPEIAAGARAALRGLGAPVRVVTGDGRDGVPARAPYDRIIVTASAETVPHAWCAQLVDDGVIVVPLRLSASGAQVIPTLRKRGGTLVSVALVAGGFMPLRPPDDATVRPAPLPMLRVTDSALRAPAAIVQLSGRGLASLSDAAKRRLVALALSEGRRRPLGLRADAEALVLYLALALPQGRAVMIGPGWRIGTIGRDGRSLAYVESRAHLGIPSIASLTVHGGTDAEDLLRAGIEEWDRRGRPGPERLRITVSYVDGTPRLRHAWRREPVRRRAPRAREDSNLRPTA